MPPPAAQGSASFIVGSPWLCVAIASSPRFCVLHCRLVLALRGHCRQPKVLRPSWLARPGSAWPSSAAQSSASHIVGSPWLCVAIVSIPTFCVLHHRLALALRGHRRQPKVLRPSSLARPGSAWPSSVAQSSASHIVGSPWICMAIASSPRFCVLHRRLALALRGHRQQPKVLCPSLSACPGSVWPSSAAQGSVSFIVSSLWLCVAIVGSPRFYVLHRRLALILRGHRQQPKVLRPSSSARPRAVWPSLAAQGSVSFIVGSPWLCVAIVDSPRFCIPHRQLVLALCGHRRRPEVLHPSSVNRGSAWPSLARVLSSSSPCWIGACGWLTQVASSEASSGQTGPDAGSVHFLSLAEMSGSKVLPPVKSQAANHIPNRFAWHALGCWMGLCQT